MPLSHTAKGLPSELNAHDGPFEGEFARFGIRVDLCLCAAAETASPEPLQTPFPTHLRPCSSKRAAAPRRRRAAAKQSTDRNRAGRRVTRHRGTGVRRRRAALRDSCVLALLGVDGHSWFIDDRKITTKRRHE